METRCILTCRGPIEWTNSMRRTGCMYKGVSPMWTSCVHVLLNRSIPLLCMFKYDSCLIGTSYETYSSYSMQVPGCICIKECEPACLRNNVCTKPLALREEQRCVCVCVVGGGHGRKKTRSTTREGWCNCVGKSVMCIVLPCNVALWEAQDYCNCSLASDSERRSYQNL